MVPLAFLLGLHNSDGRQCLELALVFYQGFVSIRVSVFSCLQLCLGLISSDRALCSDSISFNDSC